MAQFIEWALPGPQGATVYINVDHIQYMRPISTDPNRTAIHFDDDQFLTVERAAQAVVAAIK
jgi:hypothetical protein